VKDRPNCTLANGFSVREKLYAQTSFHLMGITGTVGIALADWPWALPYLFVYVFGILGVLMRHLTCPRCLHLFEHGDCLQLPARWIRMLVVGRKTTPFARTERALFYAIFTFLPLYWLRTRPILLILFLVGTAAWYLGQWLRFCRRCRVKECPSNRAEGLAASWGNVRP
jgi:hypothetical protein